MFFFLYRHLYHEDVQLQSVSTALTTLYAANKYICPELVRICVRYLDNNITIGTVLQIYQHVRFYSTYLNEEEKSDPLCSPSAPPQSELEDKQPPAEENEQCGQAMSQYCTALLYNCYHFIDSHADQVFSEESIEDLTKDALYDLAKRDTLGKLLFSELLEKNYFFIICILNILTTARIN